MKWKVFVGFRPDVRFLERFSRILFIGITTSQLLTMNLFPESKEDFLGGEGLLFRFHPRSVVSHESNALVES